MASIPRIAVDQGGVFTAEQARVEGWPQRVIRRRIVNRRWVYVAGHGLSIPSSRFTAFQLAVAAHLSMRKIVISHRTAAELHRFPLAPDDDLRECDVIVAGRPRPLPRIRAHRARLLPGDVEPGPGELWLTTPARTALDCLANFAFGEAIDLWAWLSTHGVLDLGRLEYAIQQRKGWHGTTQLRRLQKTVAGGAASQAELRLHTLLKRAGLTGWSANVRLDDGAGGSAVVDVLFEAEKVVVEIDGHRAHSSTKSFVSDRRRQNALILAGYTILRFTWPDLEDRPSAVVAEILKALGRNQLGRAR